MRILLHICCGICASSVSERLMCEGHRISGFFYNPNIHPSDEYEKRLKSVQKVANEMNFELMEGPYDRENWFQMVKGEEYISEGGKRCELCFKMRLNKTYEYMKKHMFDAFTTTLTVSPAKDAAMINRIGRETAEDKFFLADFKKKNGFLRATELSKEWNLYRQHYCGCIYSLEESLSKDKGKNKSDN